MVAVSNNWKASPIVDDVRQITAIKNNIATS